MTGLLLAAAFALIIGGAILFTNAVEWSGKRLDLGEGAVGSLLAAVGTALPESLIPVVAVLSGGESEQVAIGAIVGAPFMLGTLAMVVVGASALAFRRRRGSGSEVTADDRSVRRDLGFFLPCFAIGIGLGLIDSTSVHIAGAVGLLIAYGAYARRTVRHSGESEDVDELKPLTFDPSKEDPPRNIAIVAQLVVGLLMIVGGAELFVEEVVTVAEALGISALVLSLVLAPLATELPGEAQQRALDAPRQGHPGGRQYHWGDGVSVHRADRPRPRGDRLGPRPVRSRRRGRRPGRRRAGAVAAPRGQAGDTGGSRLERPVRRLRRLRRAGLLSRSRPRSSRADGLLTSANRCIVSSGVSSCSRGRWP